MTNKQQDLVNSFFNEWDFGSRSNDGYKEFHIRGYFQKPDRLKETKSVAQYDKSASEAIAKCQQAIEILTAYRLALAERYNEIATAPKIPVVKLIREKRWRQNVKYYLITCSRNLAEGTEIEESRKTYEGSERRQALKDFETYCRNHPGITAEKDIEKPKWER